MSIKNRSIRTQNDLDITEPARNPVDPFHRLLTRRLTVPVNGALTPDPVIRERIIRRMNRQKASQRHPLRALVRLVEIRIPAYHAALGLAVLICAFVITDRVLERSGPAYAPTVGNAPPVAQIDMGNTQDLQQQQAGLAFADSLAEYRISRSDTFFIGHTDSL